MELNIIFNRNIQDIIGVNNDLAFNIKEDLKFFKNITKSKIQNKPNVVIMGFNTWKSLPNKHLPDRINIVLTNQNILDIDTDKVSSFSSFEYALTYLSTQDYNEIFIIGGSVLYSYVFEKYKDNIKYIYETYVHAYYPISESDEVTYLKYKINNEDFKCVKNEYGIYDCSVHGASDKISTSVNFKKYQNVNKINKNENEYLILLSKVKECGTVRESRNSNVISSFSEKMKFDLRDGFPLLTTKKMGWKTILRELLWFIEGSTDNHKLNKKNVKIWNGNASKEFMKSRGLNYEEGDLGPIYGFQWRHFGDKYINKNHKYTGGVDQLKNVIDLIKNEPHSRRIIFSAWNPCDLDKMALPPCHVMVQFYIDVKNKYIDAQLIQRSGDMFLGVPFNIASYSFLLHIIGNITGYRPRYLYHILGDAHIYDSHIDSVNEQLSREPYNLPTLEITEKITDIDNIREEVFNIINYNSHPAIKTEMIA